MKLRIDVNEDLAEDEIIIKCGGLTQEIELIQAAVAEITGKRQKLVFYKGETEYFFQLADILFFETQSNTTYAHTRSDMYTVKYKLYELEQILPACYFRVSKSTIINVNEVISIQRNITASSIVELHNTHKKVFVSRNYYKLLKDKISERRVYR